MRRGSCQQRSSQYTLYIGGAVQRIHIAVHGLRRQSGLRFLNRKFTFMRPVHKVRTRSCNARNTASRRASFAGGTHTNGHYFDLVTGLSFQFIRDIFEEHYFTSWGHQLHHLLGVGWILGLRVSGCQGVPITVPAEIQASSGGCSLVRMRGRRWWFCHAPEILFTAVETSLLVIMIEEQLEELVARDELTLPATWKGGWARPAAGQHLKCQRWRSVSYARHYLNAIGGESIDTWKRVILKRNLNHISSNCSGEWPHIKLISAIYL